MNFKLLIAPPNSNDFIKYVPDKTIRDEISIFLSKKKKDRDLIEIKFDNMSILFMDIVDESNFKTGYITKNNQVIYKLRWTELFPAIDIDKLRTYLRDKKRINVPDWKLHWIADLQNELIIAYNQYINVDTKEKERFGKKIMLIRYELSLLYT